MIKPDAAAMALNDLYDRVRALEGCTVQLVQILASAGLLRVVVTGQDSPLAAALLDGETPLPGL